MKQEDKRCIQDKICRERNNELLFKDLCGRLPYGVKCYGYCFKIDGNYCECYGTLDSIKLGAWYPFHLSNRMSINNGAIYEETFSEVKPYLFPMSSMTDEQKEELQKLGWNFDGDDISNSESYYSEHTDYVTHFECYSLIDWLNKNHFDYRGLIEKGLAKDATGLGIY